VALRLGQLSGAGRLRRGNRSVFQPGPPWSRRRKAGYNDPFTPLEGTL